MRKNLLPMWRFIGYSVKINFFPFVNSWLATILYRKKEDKVGKKLLIQKKGNEKRER